MNLESVLRRLDRLAGGRHADYTVLPASEQGPRIRRAFAIISWLLVAEFVLGLASVVVAVLLFAAGTAISPAVWLRCVVVLGITVTLFYFAWRAARGYYWAYFRLRLFSKIFPIVALILVAIPGLYPLWVITEQIVFSLILIGISDYLSSDYMREAYPKPGSGGLTA